MGFEALARGRKAASVDAGPVEGPWDLPDGWRWERLGTLGEWFGGGTPSKSVAAFWSNGRIPWVSPKDMKRFDLDDTEDHITDAAVAGSSTKLVPARSVICVMRSGILKHSFPVALTSRPMTLNQDLRAVHPRPDVSPRYLAYFLRSAAQSILHECSKDGTTVDSIEAGRLMQVPVPLPTQRTAQDAIVARIDALFAEIDEGEAALAEARAAVETYRKALLKAAVTGELTADWRAANPPQETGEQLLQRILADRRARWHADPKNARKKYTEPAGPDTDGLPELPERWAWASLAQLLSGIEAGLNVKAHGRPPAEGETGIVKISAVTWDEFDEGQSKALFLNTKIDERNLIAVGDLLISRANTIELVGAPAIVRRLSKRLVLSDKILRLIVPREFKEWLYFVIKSTFGRQHIESRSTGNQLSMRNISQDSLRALPVPIPPVEELDMLLDMLHVGWREQRFLSEWLADNSVSSTLHQSILAAAFRGELAA